jgi:uncharacterized membrane protein (UPF0127 family)
VARYVRVINLTKGGVVAERCKVAESLVQRVFGLHLLPRLASGEGLLLPRSTTIDTTFMRYPIDLAFLDRSGKVTRTVADLAPWRFALWNPGARDCLELPAGALAQSGTASGDQLLIEEIPPQTPG